MKIKVLTKDHGEFTSNKLEDCNYEEVLTLVNEVSKGDCSNLRFNSGNTEVLFSQEVLRSSVLIIIKEPHG